MLEPLLLPSLGPMDKFRRWRARCHNEHDLGRAGNLVFNPCTACKVEGQLPLTEVRGLQFQISSLTVDLTTTDCIRHTKPGHL